MAPCFPNGNFNIYILPGLIDTSVIITADLSSNKFEAFAYTINYKLAKTV